MRDQIRRVAVSIFSNIAEGFERGGSAEFIRFPGYEQDCAGKLQNLKIVV
ncbi:MAG TPA: four helix bundle protein [bacterium]|nr:four helix bundle protein [bacterium]HQL61169.1 four helix bundle protein [bacterium]